MLSSVACSKRTCLERFEKKISLKLSNEVEKGFPMKNPRSTFALSCLLSLFPSVPLSICPSFLLSLFLSLSLSLSLSVSVSVSLSFFLSVSLCLSICLSVCIPLYRQRVRGSISLWRAEDNTLRLAYCCCC